MRFRDRSAGALLLLAFLLFCAGGLSRFVPDDWAGAVVPRFAETLAPWSLALGLLIALVAAWLGARKAGPLLALCCLIAAGGLLVTHLRLSLPFASSPAPSSRIASEAGDIRVMFFNVLFSNKRNAEAIARMVIQENPDIVIFAEAEGVRPAFPLLKAHFAYSDICKGELCDPVVFSNLRPKKAESHSLGAMDGKKMFEGTFETPEGDLSLFGVHMLKPWISGYAEAERRTLLVLANRSPQTSLMIGDFNAPTWSSRLSEIMSKTGFRAMRMPIPTWPAQAGNLGVPIDHALVRGKTRIVSARAVGGDLGSNHRGLLVTLHLGS